MRAILNGVVYSPSNALGVATTLGLDLKELLGRFPHLFNKLNFRAVEAVLVKFIKNRYIVMNVEMSTFIAALSGRTTSGSIKVLKRLMARQ